MWCFIRRGRVKETRRKHNVIYYGPNKESCGRGRDRMAAGSRHHAAAAGRHTRAAKFVRIFIVACCARNILSHYRRASDVQNAAVRAVKANTSTRQLCGSRPSAAATRGEGWAHTRGSSGRISARDSRCTRTMARSRFFAQCMTTVAASKETPAVRVRGT